MPKRAKELEAKQVERLKADSTKNRRIMVGPADCAGLHLRIEGGTKSWALRMKVGEKRRDIGLGPYNGKAGATDKEAAALPGLSLAEARTKAREIRRTARETGQLVSPTWAKAEAVRVQEQAAILEAAKAKTFKECAEAFLEAQKPKWKNANAKHVAQWSSTLATYAYPKIGELPVDKVDTGLILEVLQQPTDGGALWATKTETASRLRGRIEKVLAWATFRGYRQGDNPARWRGHLDNELPARGDVRKVKHHAALPYAEIGAFMVDLRKREGLSARALEFAVLTAARSNEVRMATWDEIDLDRGLWTIPKERMKAKKEHVVPLSDAAVALLTALPRIRGKHEYVFPAPRGGAFSDAVFRALFERMDREGLTQHGFRSTFRDWAGETTEYPREVIEHALAHQLADKAEAAYQRGTLMPKRMLLMAEWSKFCGTVPTDGDNVISIRGAA